MSKIFKSLTILAGLALLSETSLAQQVFVYRCDSLERPYVISRNYTDPIGKIDVSEVIEAKTFSAKSVGATAEVTLSNAVIFTALIPRNSAVGSAAKINQYVVTADSLVLRLDENEKIVQNGSVGGDEKEQSSAPQKYEGTNVVQYLKDHGLWPPPEPKN